MCEIILSKRCREGITSVWVGLLLILPLSGFGQQMAVSTNLAGYLNFGTINGEFGLSVSPKWSVYLQGRLNPFTFRSRNNLMENGYPRQMQNRQVAGFIGAKYWFWHTHSGWFLFSHLGYVKYNVGGIFTNDTYQGRAYGVTLGGGYSLMLSSRLNLDFGIGVMGGITSYLKYLCPRCGEITGEDKRLFIAPDNFLIQLSYLF